MIAINARKPNSTDREIIAFGRSESRFDLETDFIISYF